MNKQLPDFDHETFLRKAKRYIAMLPLALECMTMYFAMLDAQTPIWVKVTVGSALVYFCSPFDVVPDAIPLVGFGDDAAVLAGAVKLVADHLLPSHYDQAREWFAA